MPQDSAKRLRNFSLFVKKNFFIKSSSAALSSLAQLTFLASVSCLLAGVSALFALPSKIIFDFYSLFITAAVAYSAAKDSANRLLPALLAVLCFCALLPFESALPWLGLPGYFSAIAAGFLSFKLYSAISAFKPDIELPGNVHSSVFDEYIAYIPVIGTAAVFVALRILFSFTAEGHVLYYAYMFIQRPLLHLVNTPLMILLVPLFAQILWYNSIHGAITVMSIYVPFFNALTIENLLLIRDGLAPANIINLAFFWVYAFPGGAGATLSLAVLMFFFSRSKKMKAVVKTSFLLNFFAVNEPIVMGLPMARNAAIAFPFIFLPLINSGLAMALTYAGVLPVLSGIYLPFTTPFFITGFVNGGLRIVLFQCLLLILDMLIYLPFFIKLDRAEKENEEDGD